MVAGSASLVSAFRVALLSLGQGLDLLLLCLELSLKRKAPTAAVNCLPALGVDVQGFQVAPADILVAQLETFYRSLACGKLAIQDVLWYAPIFHPAHVAEPALPSLSKKRVQEEGGGGGGASPPPPPRPARSTTWPLGTSSSLIIHRELFLY